MDSSAPELDLLAALSWIDLTALSIVLVFFVIGLFRGFVWQFSRIVTLVLAYVAAGLYGDPVAARMDSWFPQNSDPRLPLYIAYFCVFLIVLVVVSILAHFVEKLVNKSGLSFYNRIGGGILGIGTGACVVLAMLATVIMFFATGSNVVEAAQRSRSMAVSQGALEFLGTVVPQPVREVFGVEAESPSAAPESRQR